MAKSANIVHEIRTTGADTNGGGYVPGAGTDYSQQNSPQLALTDVVTNGTTTITSVTGGFTSAMNNNYAYVSGGSGSVAAETYQLTFVNSNTATLDRSTGLTAGTGVTLNLGGAFATPGWACGKSVAGNSFFWKNGTYTLTTNTANVSGGPVSYALGGSSGTSPSKWEGYNTTRGDMGAPPVLNAGARTGLTLFSVNTSNYNMVVNIAVDGNSGATTTGIVIDSPRSWGYKLTAQNTTVRGIQCGSSGADGTLLFCKATGYSGTCGIEIIGVIAFSETYGGACTGLLMNPTGSGNPTAVIGHISSGNAGGSSNGCVVGGRNSVVVGSIFALNGKDGIDYQLSGGGFGANNICEGNAGVGINASGGTTRLVWLFNNAYYNNTGGNVSANIINNIGGVLGTGTFFVNAASGNFAPNTNANGGLLLKATAYPGLMPRGATMGYADIGIQHQDSGGGSSGMLFIPSLEGT